MPEKLNLLLFGATGYTGKSTIPYIHKLATSNGRNLTWGVAGRSEEKLRSILRKAGEKIGQDFASIPIIIADIKDDKSLVAMAEKTNVLINCCGPYRFLGEQVVKACIAAGTHYVDVNGEPQFMERMQLDYNDAAASKGIYIVNACGFDSIPADLGVVFLQQEFEGTLNSVVTYLEGALVEGGADLPGPTLNYGTWESMVHGVGNAGELEAVRNQLYPTPLPSFRPKLKAKWRPHKNDLVEGWIVPFPGADRSVILRSQRYFYDVESKRPLQVETYFIIKTFMGLVQYMIFGMFFTLLTKSNFGRSLLLKHPRVFSFGNFRHEQPLEEKVEKNVFSITLYGEGWKEKLTGPTDNYTTPINKSILAKVKGRNPAYGTTCLTLVTSAILLITEPEKLPNRGGVYTPGAAFAKTSIIKQLNANGLTFEVISKKDI